MPKLSIALGLLAVAVCLTGGCGSKTESASNSNAPGSAVAGRPELPLARIDPATAGSIRGRIHFAGQRPALAAIDFSANPVCDRMHVGKPEKEETALVNPNGTLRNVFVWIKSGLREARWEPPPVPAKIDQAGCIYLPHVLGLMVNQELQVNNSDSLNHDVHAESKQNEPFNVLEPPRSETVSHRFVHEEVWFPISCGVHPWMRTYVAVVSHPFFAVTGADGSFELKGVPPGTYSVETVHEKYGRKEQKVSVAAKQTAEADFTYAE